MIRWIDVRDIETAQALLELQRVSYRVEADLIGSDAIPPLHETLEDVRRCGETFLGFYRDGRLAGAMSYQRDQRLLDIHRLMVHPDFFRRGIARSLVQSAMAAERGVARIIVQTGSLNVPARSLYRRLGFSEIGEREVVPGLWVTEFACNLDPYIFPSPPRG